jgi:hypothetical protein
MVIDVEHVEEEQGGLAYVELVDVHQKYLLCLSARGNKVIPINSWQFR